MNTTQNIIIIGLTGQSGAGKSTASEMFRGFGIPVIDCDEVSHYTSAVPAFLEEVKAVYPDCVENGSLARQKLAAIVFNDTEELKKYTSLIFPYITYEVFRRIRKIKSQGGKVVILDAPTLFESDIHLICSAVISVIAPFDVKVERILERDGIPVDLVQSRISSQHAEKYFSERSDWLIINDGGRDDLLKRAGEIAAEIKERFDV